MGMENNVSHLIYIIFSPIVSLIFVSLNIWSIHIFVKKFHLASLSLVILMNICFCDIAVSLVSNNFYVWNLVHPKYAWVSGATACKLFKTLTMMCNLSQIFSFVILCLDRMRRLTLPTNPQWRKVHGLGFVALIWALAVLMTGGRFVLYDEKVITKWDNSTNSTRIVNCVCKPIGINTTGYAIMTIVQFILGYAVPLIMIIGTIITCEVKTRQSLKIIGETIGNSSALQMNRQLSRVFNMTAVWFMLIWTPFFIMSVLDLNLNLIGKKELTHLNFSFRCTLLVIGAGKPLIYILNLKRFRAAMCRGICIRDKEMPKYQPTVDSSKSTDGTESSSQITKTTVN